MSEKTALEEAEAYLERRRDRPDHECINEDDQWEDDDITYGTVRALVAQVRLDEGRLTERDRVVKDLRAHLRAAINLLPEGEQGTAYEIAGKVLEDR